MECDYHDSKYCVQARYNPLLITTQPITPTQGALTTSYTSLLIRSNNQSTPHTINSSSLSPLLLSPRCFFDDLLVPSLDGTFTLVEVDSIAMLVTQHLHLDVTWIVYELLNQHSVVSETRRGFRLRQIETFPTWLNISRA